MVRGEYVRCRSVTGWQSSQVRTSGAIDAAFAHTVAKSASRRGPVKLGSPNPRGLVSLSVSLAPLLSSHSEN